MDKSIKLTDKTFKLLFLCVMTAGVLVRIWRFGAVPGGLNQDEAFAGYEAWSLLTTGMDTAGYRLPVYLTAWGSGMNALNSYLMIPFIALFGLKVWVIRLPQLIVAVLTLPAVYGIVRRISGRQQALTAMFLLAVAPWHIMLSRWGLESNLAPGFLVFGLYFFLRGLESPRFLPISAMMYGLSLYCYATVWPLVPVIVLLQCLYSLRTGRLKLGLELLVSGLVLAVFALPLLMFLAVNYGYMDELRLPLLSIPKLLYMRSGELSLSRIPENLKTAWEILITQSDGLPWNCAGVFGQLYMVSLPFELVGLVVCIVGYIRSVRDKCFKAETIILIQLLAGLILVAIVEVNVNRENIIFIPRLLLAAQGLCYVSKSLGKKLLAVFVFMYLILFVLFSIFYFGAYSKTLGFYYGEGAGEAINAALESEGEIYVSRDIYYPVVLFYSETHPDEFRSSVKYVSYPAAYLQAESFGRFRFVRFGGELERDGVYILSPYDDIAVFEDNGFTLTLFEHYILAEPN